eukprot:4547490-Prymnesium_polylepis.1
MPSSSCARRWSPWSSKRRTSVRRVPRRVARPHRMPHARSVPPHHTVRSRAHALTRSRAHALTRARRASSGGAESRVRSLEEELARLGSELDDAQANIDVQVKSRKPQTPALLCPALPCAALRCPALPCADLPRCRRMHCDRARLVR